MSVDEIKEKMKEEIQELVKQGRYSEIPSVVSKYLPSLMESSKQHPSININIENDENNDAEELRQVLSAVSDFIKNLEEPLKKLVDLFFGMLDGEKLGKEVAAFYRQLVEAEVPEQLASEMTKEYFEKRTAIANILKNLQNLGDLMKLKSPPIPIQKSEDKGRQEKKDEEE